MNVSYIGLGSNLDHPAAQLARAKQSLAALPSTTLLAASGIYRSAALTLPGAAAQPDYLNAVIKIQTGLTPHALLDAMHAIELAQGRQRNERWAARSLDLDILLYDHLQLNEPGLTVPHPGIAQRSFVLYPLQELEPAMEIPACGKLATLLAQLAATTRCERLGSFDEVAGL